MYKRQAQPSQIRVVLRCENDGVSLSVEDDGLGFDAGTVLSSSDGSAGLGILGLRERMEMLSGTLQIESQPGRGTLLVGRVPLRHSGAENEGTDP